jgi:CDP-diacylglycerol--glycerol-3-phosphate 3-phosphatidyltransferase
MPTRFGEFLDSTLDRFSDMAVLVGLATHFAIVGRPGCVLLTGAALTATVLVSYSAACAKLSTPTGINVGIFERGERVGVLAAGAILGFPVLALWVLAIGSSLTVAQRFARAYREMSRLDAAESTGLADPGLSVNT